MEALYPKDIAIGAQSYPFLNSGNIAGRAKYILGMHRIIRNSLGDNFWYDDQRALQVYFIENHHHGVKLDHDGAIFWSLHKCGCSDDIQPGEQCDPCRYHIQDGQINSLSNNKQPAVMHGNGLDGKQIFGHIANEIFP
jgi:hypothetical protein